MPPNKRLKLTIQPVTARALVWSAPGRLTAHAQRYGSYRLLSRDAIKRRFNAILCRNCGLILAGSSTVTVESAL